jgi:hypothetical protein
MSNREFIRSTLFLTLIIGVRYPDSGGFMQVSAVGFDTARARAIVYMAHSCGGLCGGGTYHFLQKIDGVWREVKVQGMTSCTWVS